MAAAGVSPLRVFLGRQLSSAATRASSSGVCTDRSVAFGKYWRSRPLVFSSSVLTIVVAFVATNQGGPRPTLNSGLPVVALGILVLLALTSPGSRGYAQSSRRGGHKEPEPALGHLT